MDMYKLLFDKPYTNNEWHMVYGERIALLYLLEQIKPEISIEIGTFKGGSLSPISHFSNEVYTFDFEHDGKLKDEFSNVNFVTGDSRVNLPEIINLLNSREEALEFVLIDGDHSEEGVKSDINLVLKYKPKKPLYILMHDSFNPEVRTGILKADWKGCPYVHHIEIDFVHGTLHDRQEIHKQMWGGLSLAILLPEERDSSMSFSKLQEFLYQSVFQISSHIQ